MSTGDGYNSNSWSIENQQRNNETDQINGSGYSQADRRDTQDQNSGETRGRPRLQLKPRSANAGNSGNNTASSSKSNPFGSAKPREEVLASKGIDSHLVDARIEQKAQPKRLTAAQEAEVESIRAELTQAEEGLRDANERELPEEKFRVLCESKRKELNEVMASFTEMNVGKGGFDKQTSASSSNDSTYSANGQTDRSSNVAVKQKTYERPSERRRRLEQERNGGGTGGSDQDAFTSFGGRERSSGRSYNKRENF
mmetsp:Transcript_33656/g.38977  ORF Transcript_33656/g.38977 Transcript_33656/m.38977 type:complete len:255 (+) Transcript_33656:111-875(+)|eukprot:CAMPEP_0171292954 /NCGR_PEP_ID=MMETSP0816-20121228/975_1 /TAXON_ID=420281 /ORGANISM="Proboscia inermis, Strain CCAP1064/1" /LENGTH=254 /DNA_ID=CAMNT_0011763211 /DNA_START=24 /DNA_END=788 /DNA_ORIENTATION=+